MFEFDILAYEDYKNDYIGWSEAALCKELDDPGLPREAVLAIGDILDELDERGRP